MMVFVNGKQKRIRRPPTIDGMDVDSFIRQNADPIWLHQNGMWEDLNEVDEGRNSQPARGTEPGLAAPF